MLINRATVEADNAATASASAKGTVETDGRVKAETVKDSPDDATGDDPTARRGAPTAPRVAFLLLGAGGVARADDGDPTAPTATTAWLARVTSPTELRDGPSESSNLMETVQPSRSSGGDTQLQVKDVARTGDACGSMCACRAARTDATLDARRPREPLPDAVPDRDSRGRPSGSAW